MKPEPEEREETLPYVWPSVRTANLALAELLGLELWTKSGPTNLAIDIIAGTRTGERLRAAFHGWRLLDAAFALSNSLRDGQLRRMELLELDPLELRSICSLILAFLDGEAGALAWLEGRRRARERDRAADAELLAGALSTGSRA